MQECAPCMVGVIQRENGGEIQNGLGHVMNDVGNEYIFVLGDPTKKSGDVVSEKWRDFRSCGEKGSLSEEMNL